MTALQRHRRDDPVRGDVRGRWQRHVEDLSGRDTNPLRLGQLAATIRAAPRLADHRLVRVGHLTQPRAGPLPSGTGVVGSLGGKPTHPATGWRPSVT